MIEAPDATSTRPYLIRAMYEWCTDNGFTPYIAVAVDESVLVPREYVKDGEIVLNISFDATSALKLGNEFIEFKGRFAGVAREIMVPVSQVIAIYARENGQGMAFPMEAPRGTRALSSPATSLTSVPDAADASAEVKVVQLASVESDRGNEDPDPPRPSPVGPRPALKRVK
ncbi:ClpXP protease specificity-enhancing factor [Rhodoferax sp.]|uniref:ClpXP protease specificity-enhancing factor n=1 Tax=Rhodoferax sp. TaxID=50421 RepID=UPI001EBED9FB|nr:ClpXP protease specificity-enhancing factor [Rhodoferax sp.]MBT9506031.1 ClpXP protease specificity-enhancing factor [Rhodoferax sp.]